MKVIELLNKIANGEDVPKKIKYGSIIYEYRGYMYCTENPNYQDIDDYIFGKWNFNILNNEIEIIEEDKKIEYIEGRIKNFKHYIEDSCFRVQPLEDLELNQNEIVIIDKINEIIDKINEMENK